MKYGNGGGVTLQRALEPLRGTRPHHGLVAAPPPRPCCGVPSVQVPLCWHRQIVSASRLAEPAAGIIKLQTERHSPGVPPCQTRTTRLASAASRWLASCYSSPIPPALTWNKLTAHIILALKSICDVQMAWSYFIYLVTISVSLTLHSILQG